MTGKTIKWILFAALTVSFPTVWFIFAADGILPLGIYYWGIVASFVHYNDVFIWLIFSLLYTPLLYFLAAFAARLIVRRAGSHRAALLWLVVAGILGMGLFPMYGSGHSGYTGQNVYRLYGSYFRR